MSVTETSPERKVVKLRISEEQSELLRRALRRYEAFQEIAARSMRHVTGMRWFRTDEGGTNIFIGSDQAIYNPEAGPTIRNIIEGLEDL